MVFYLSNRFTNPIMFGIILKMGLSSMLWHNFHKDIIIQTHTNIIVKTCTVVYWKTLNFSDKYNILHVQNIKNSS